MSIWAGVPLELARLLKVTSIGDSVATNGEIMSMQNSCTKFESPFSDFCILWLEVSKPMLQLRVEFARVRNLRNFHH